MVIAISSPRSNGVTSHPTYVVTNPLLFWLRLGGRLGRQDGRQDGRRGGPWTDLDDFHVLEDDARGSGDILEWARLIPNKEGHEYRECRKDNSSPGALTLRLVVHTPHGISHRAYAPCGSRAPW